MWKGLKSFINNMQCPSACFSLERESILATAGVSVQGDVVVCAAGASLSDWTACYLSPVAGLHTAARQVWPFELLCHFSVTALLPPEELLKRATSASSAEVWHCSFSILFVCIVSVPVGPVLSPFTANCSHFLLSCFYLSVQCYHNFSHKGFIILNCVFSR